MIPYIGNAYYCYANSASMLLSTIGENIQPSQIEVLTGVSLGAWKGRSFMFSMNAPNKGLSKAIEILGFNFKEEVSHRDTGAPFERLREILHERPALLGPLDLGYLTYFPERGIAAGSDHYALALEIDDDSVTLHDPLGFPHVSISQKDLENAWRAQRVTYKRDYYRMWHTPERVNNPTKKEIFREALRYFKKIYIENPVFYQSHGELTGSKAIYKVADEMRTGKLTKTEQNTMIYFTLALGAKRSLDYAFFFSDHDEELSPLKLEQSKMLGECHALAVKGDWMKVSDILYELGTIEDAFKELLLSS